LNDFIHAAELVSSLAIISKPKDLE
jgi:hypothetical protein